MNKHLTVTAICAALALTLFSGCAASPDPEDPVQSNFPAIVTDPAVSESPFAPEPTAEVSNSEAEQAFLDFLNGKTRAMTSESFRTDDAEFNFDGLLYGSYSYAELKSAIAELEGRGSVAKYCLQDFGHDGVSELVLRFENTDSSFMNWVGILKYNGSGLDINYYYEDGYRTFSKLYTSSYLQIGGAISAGGSLSTIVEFDENGIGSTVFTQSQFYGIFAGSIAYDLQNGESGLADSYDDIAAASLLQVREYSANGEVKISAREWSGDAAVREREEALIGELETLGAELITEAEMDELCSLSPYEAAEVEWLDWNDASDVEALLSADYAPDELLGQVGTYHEFIADDSEYQVMVLLSAQSPVTELRVLSLSMEETGDTGEISFRAEELYYLASLTPEKPLVVGMVFIGAIPNTGVSYVDSSGTEHAYAVVMSGEDGSLLLSEVSLNR